MKPGEAYKRNEDYWLETYRDYFSYLTNTQLRHDLAGFATEVHIMQQMLSIGGTRDLQEWKDRQVDINGEPIE
jgi:hypothetical protein